MKIVDLFKVQQYSETYNENGNSRTIFYVQSGMLVHYIYDNQLLPKVGTYFDLKENLHLPIEEAIQQAFGMSVQQFDKTLRDYISRGQYRYYPIPTPATAASNTYTATSLKAEDGSAVLADIHLHSRDYQDRAIGEFQEILKADPNSAAACRGLGYGYLQKQDYNQASEYFKRASQMDSKDPRVHYYNALLMVREGGFMMGTGGPSTSGLNVDEMTKELETSISLDPNFADSYALLAFAQSTHGEGAKAVASMEKALAMNPRSDEYAFNLANLYMSNRQPEKAVTLLASLRSTENPAVAARVADMLAEIKRFQQMMKEDLSLGGDVSATLVRREGSGAADSVPTSAPPAKSTPAKFLRGTLASVDCSTTPKAVLTVVSGGKQWKMNVADTKHVILIGADDFSCTWAKLKVAVNYRETSEMEGSIISLEIQ